MSLVASCNHFKKLPRFQVKLLPFLSSFSSSTSKAPPPPICVGITDSAGRGVFATRRIGAGELIHTAEPIVSHPSLSSLHAVCYFCLRKLSNQSANSDSSQIASFCSERCEKQSENFYEVEKKADWSRFYEYCRCGILITQSERFVFDLLVLTEEWYSCTLARIRINAFRIELPGGLYEDLFSAAASVEAEIAVGNAVYMLPSLYNHDCDPNVNILWIDNADAKLKSLCDIEAGEELRICYIDASMGYVARQAILREGFGFYCNCVRCMSKD